MRKNLIWTLIVFLVFLSRHVYAANFSDPIDGIYRGAYGDTISVEVPSLVSKSPVTENQNGDLSFGLNANTGYRNFNQLTDLKYGDPVRVEYNEDPSGKSKQMTAVVITKLGSAIVDNPVNAVDTNDTLSPTATQTITTTTTTRINSQ